MKESFNLPNPITSAALAAADRALLTHDDAIWTARHLADEVSRRAAQLHALGIKASDRVALVALPSVDWVLAYHAIGWLGATAVAIPPRESQAETMRMLQSAKSTAILHDEAHLEILQKSTLPQFSISLSDPKIALEERPEERFWPLDEIRAIVFSSGTTSAARPVELTTGQLLFSAFGSAIRLEHQHDDAWLLCLPLHHIAGLSILMRCAWMGTTVLLHTHFDAEKVSAALDTQATLASLVPTMLRRVLDLRGDRPFASKLRAILVGGAPTESDLIDRCRQISAPIALTWGMTETASQATTRFAGDLRATADSGPPLAFARVESVEGRLYVKGPIADQGQVKSADLGVIDGDGNIRVLDRADDVIISGGEKIIPAEVEAVLIKHPKIKDVAIVGQSHPDWGKRPVAYLVSDETLSTNEGVIKNEIAEEFYSFCEIYLSSFKIPDLFIQKESLPRSTTGKLLRRKLKEEIVIDASLDKKRHSPKTRIDPVLDRLEAASAEHGNQALMQKLVALRNFHAEDLEEVTRHLSESADEEGNLGEKAAHHLAIRSGKQIRALCVLIASRLNEKELSKRDILRSRELAAAAEMVHAATLLHDDVVDQGDERRGSPTARVIYGNKASILGGDHLLVEALARVNVHGSPELLTRLIEVIRKMVAGEALQLEREREVSSDPATYLRIVEGKTAALFSWALRAGGSLAALPDRQLEALEAVGRPLGIAFQLVDDLLDLQGDPTLLGKARLVDLLEGKMTWPLMMAAREKPELGEAMKELAKRAAAGNPPDEKELAAFAEKIQHTQAADATLEEAQLHTMAAHQALLQLPSSQARASIQTVIDLCTKRVS